MGEAGESEGEAMIECEECGRDTPQAMFEQPWGRELRAKCNVCGHITVEQIPKLKRYPSFGDCEYGYDAASDLD